MQEAPERSFFVTYAARNDNKKITSAPKTLVINTGIDDRTLEDLTRIYFSQPAEEGRQIYPQAEDVKEGGVWPSKSDDSLPWTNIFKGAVHTSVNEVYDKTSVLFMPKSKLLTAQEQDSIETFTSIRGLDQRTSQEPEIAPSPNIISFTSTGNGSHMKLAYNIEANKPQIKAFDISPPNETFPFKNRDESSQALNNSTLLLHLI